MNDLREGVKQCLYTIRHPINGFDQVKWEKKGSMKVCVLILAAFFLTNVFTQVLTGFIFNPYNPDDISVLSIFVISIGGFAVCFFGNWAVSSLMFTEGETRNIFLVLCYTLVPYIFCTLLFILATNFANMEVMAFLMAIWLIGVGWSAVVLLVGMLYIHHLSFGRMLLNLLATLVAMLAILMLILLVYNLLTQMYTFVYTIVNEIIFRL